MSKHTKGPWRQHPHLDSATIKSESGRLIAEFDTLALKGEDKPWTEDEDVANAQLGAAAPELLQRLREAREAIEEMPEDFLGTVHKDGDSWPMRNELLHRIGKAIAKAEGGPTDD